MNQELKPQIKGRIHLDEKYVKVKKENYYDLNAIDHKTKYILAHLFVKKRTPQKCIEFLKQIKINCYSQILERHDQKNDVIFVSDKFGCYKLAFNKLFYFVAKLHFGVSIKCEKFGLKHNNNPIERYNQDIDDRIKTMRNFGSDERAGYFLNLKRMVHNLINPHMQLKGKTPAETAGINLSLGRNKLLKLINNYAKQKVTKR